MSILLLVGLSMSPAHAGWWKDFCEKHLIAEYRPYKDVPSERLEAKIKRWNIRQDFWGPLSLDYQQTQELADMREELWRRNTVDADDFGLGGYPERDLTKEIDRLQIKVNWNTATPFDAKKLGLMKFELGRRKKRNE